MDIFRVSIQSYILTNLDSGEIETIGKKYEESTFYLTQLDDIGEFRKFDQELRDHGKQMVLVSCCCAH